MRREEDMRDAEEVGDDSSPKHGLEYAENKLVKNSKAKETKFPVIKESENTCQDRRS